jgi:hypothetical protein
MDEQSKSWETYEQVATYVLNQIADRFKVDRFEGKQDVLGTRSGTTYEIDAKGIVENETAFIIVECRRYLSSRQNQEKVGALAYRIIDTGAKGGVIVSPLGLQEGAIKIAAAENIHHVILPEDSSFEQYVVKLLNEIIMRTPPVTSGFRVSQSHTISQDGVIIDPKHN